MCPARSIKASSPCSRRTPGSPSTSWASPDPSTGVPFDRRVEVELDAKNKALELHPGFPDLVLVHRDPEDRKRGAVIVVEAQKDPNPDKRWMIPVYQALLAKQHKLDTWVAIVSFSKSMSRALRAWAMGPPPKVDTLLLDVDSVPTAPWLYPNRSETG